MVKHEISLDNLFQALSDPTRRAIIEHLAHGEATVAELADPFVRRKRMSWPAVTKHLHVLENAGLIVRRKAGRTHHIRLAAEPMRDASEWLSQYRAFWEKQFDNIEQLVQEQETVGD
jgi:DNA-binding transcriptional ArsR family regulator